MKAAVLGLLLAALSSGCAVTDSAARAAASLDTRLGAYQEAQRRRVDTLNERYRRLHARLMRELATVGFMTLDHSFDLDALRSADELAAKWEDGTAPGQLRDRFSKHVPEQRARLDALDAQLAAARNAWAEAYQTAELELSRLVEARAQLQAIGDGTTDQRLHDLVKTVVQIYQTREKERRRGEKTP